MYKNLERHHAISERSGMMNKKIKLTPKDVLYISDVLNQLGSYSAELSEDLDEEKNKGLKTSKNSIFEGLSEQLNVFQKILTEANKTYKKKTPRR